MATISNKTERPLRVPLSGGKVLHLGPKMSGQIASGSVKHPPLAAMLEAGTIELVAEDDSAAQRGQGGGKPGRMAAGARASSTGSHRSGDR